jgi:hypothetical protein
MKKGSHDSENIYGDMGCDAMWTSTCWLKIEAECSSETLVSQIINPPTSAHNLESLR